MSKAVIGVFVALVLSAAACGKSDSTTPGSPSASPGASTAVPAGNGSATISGVVVGSFGAASLRPASSSISVTVVGTSISASIDGAGRFTLQNVPSGDLTLAFSGNGHDARVTISGVEDRQQINISVNLGANSADVDDDERETPDNRAQVEGRIVSITCGATSSTMVVGQMRQTTVMIPAGTPIHHGNTSLTCSQLTVGLRVHVKGMKTGTTVTATEVIVQGEPGPGEANEAEVKGTVSAIASRSCGTNAIVFTVMSSGGVSTMVTTNASTRFEDTTCATLAVNDRVEVKGTRQTSGGILASKVEGEENDDNDRNEVELKGTLGAWNASACPVVSSAVSGKAFSTNASTRFEDTTCAALRQGDRVEVKGTRQASGSVLASKVEKDD